AQRNTEIKGPLLVVRDDGSGNQFLIALAGSEVPERNYSNKFARRLCGENRRRLAQKTWEHSAVRKAIPIVFVSAELCGCVGFSGFRLFWWASFEHIPKIVHPYLAQNLHGPQRHARIGITRYMLLEDLLRGGMCLPVFAHRANNLRT